MKLTFVNVGYGEAILAEWPDVTRQDHTFIALIDGGSSDEQEYCGTFASERIPVWKYMKEKKITHLDLMICTHIHEDHVGGLRKVAEMLPPKVLWQSFSPDFYKNMYWIDPRIAENPSQNLFLHALNNYKYLCEITRKNGGIIQCIHGTNRLSFGENKTVQVLAPSKARLDELENSINILYKIKKRECFLKKLSWIDQILNNHSLIFKFDWEGTSILLPGDTNQDGFQEIPSELLKADLFKVGHHGQIDSMNEKLLKHISPKAVVCCAASDKRYNSAHEEVVKMVERIGAQLYFSDYPNIKDMEIPAHQTLEFTIHPNHLLHAKYITKKGVIYE